MEDEERSHRGEAIGRAGDQCPEDRKNQTDKKKKSVVRYDTSEPGVMIDFSSLFFFFLKQLQ